MTKFGTYVKPNCITCPQMKDIPAEDITWLEEHNLVLAVACSRCSVGIDNLTLEDAKWLQERRLLLVANCRDCSEMFIITADEAVWLLENELKMFKRCTVCRKKNKEKIAKIEEKIFEVEGFRVEITDADEVNPDQQAFEEMAETEAE